VKPDPRTAAGAPRPNRGRLLGLAAALVVGGGVLVAGRYAPFGHIGSAQSQPAAEADSRQPSLPGELPPQVADAAVGEPRFVALSDAEAWARLPDRTSGERGPLPVWARVLASTLPRTAAAMLELDYLHRTGTRLPPDVRGLIRWAAARAGRCTYGETYALADLRSSGFGGLADRLAAGEMIGLPPEQRAAVTFAERLTTDPRTVTDFEVAALIGRYGERPVVAMVLLLAHAQFQDRLALALGLTVEPGGPIPPLAVRFAKHSIGIATAPPPRRPATGPVTTLAPEGPPADWRCTDLDQIQCNLDEQRARRPRIGLPATDPSANRWGLVGQTYQPELASAWSACTQAFGEEADEDPVFEQSVFWVVTQTKGCFY
jgi:alkylhydroperoxidase family enzyme